MTEFSYFFGERIVLYRIDGALFENNRIDFDHIECICLYCSNAAIAKFNFLK